MICLPLHSFCARKTYTFRYLNKTNSDFQMSCQTKHGKKKILGETKHWVRQFLFLQLYTFVVYFIKILFGKMNYMNLDHHFKIISIKKAVKCNGKWKKGKTCLCKTPSNICSEPT